MFKRYAHQFFAIILSLGILSTLCMESSFAPTSLKSLQSSHKASTDTVDGHGKATADKQHDDSTIEPSKFNPQNTKFAFDFHDVVVKAHPYRIINGLVNWNMVPELSWDLPYNAARMRYNFPWVAYGTAQLMYTKSTGEQYYDLFQRNGFDRIARAIITIANDLDVINGTIKIINELKDKGYQVDMASDIGQSFLS